MLVFNVTINRFIHELTLPETSFGYQDFNWYVDDQFLHVYLTNSNAVTYHSIVMKDQIPVQILEKLSTNSSVLGIVENKPKDDLSGLKQELLRLAMQKG